MSTDADDISTKTDGATIKSISENVVVNPGDEAKLSCVVDGKDGSQLFVIFSLSSSTDVYHININSILFVICLGCMTI